MTDVDDFLAEIHPRLVAELQALHNGDPQPRLAMWSPKDPVTLFGAGMSGSGWEPVRPTRMNVTQRQRRRVHPIGVMTGPLRAVQGVVW